MIPLFTNVGFSMQSRTRRKIVKGITALSILGVVGCNNKSSVSRGPETKNSNDVSQAKTYVLVHGAWHGGWCWRDVKSKLTDENHIVHTPTLSGLGKRANLMSKDISLETHINDVSNVILENDLSNVILVGHSYGGMIITGVVDRLREYIKHVVYLDAVIPEDGQSMLTSGPQLPKEILEQTEIGLRSLSKDGVAMEALPPESFGVFPDHPSYEWVAQNLTPHPLRTWFDKIQLVNGLPDGMGKSFIHCVNPVLSPSNIPYFAAQTKGSAAWHYHELSTGHDAMITAPKKLTEILAAI